ncbi:MAG: Gfo/Idh/MocA family oxidoreductase, partial [Candidatus Omnitrophota bacterium]|nr:Gfo/Idh/MocA family oxidoreductase [Candidatus Omnitrophota bacterium]
MVKNKIRLAVIGVGYWGLNLVRVFSRLSVLYAICDSDPNKLVEAKKIYPKVNTTLSYADILNDKTISAVVISTPAESHYNLAKEALLADKDVFVEKPLALNMEEGRELLELSEKNKKILRVGHLLE